MGQKKNKQYHRIVLTGGHAGTTALAVVEELIRRSSKVHQRDIYWIGTKKALEGKQVPTIESIALPKIGVKFKPIITGRIQRRFTFWTIPSAAKIPIGLLHAFILLAKIKPSVILSFGGFAAFPVVFTGWILRIPIVIHEQTSVVGRANKLSAPFAKRIALSRRSSLKYFPKEKAQIIGNPILTQVASITPKKSISTPPVIYITGGSRGSVSLNTLVSEILAELLGKYVVIHQTGYVDFDKYKKIKIELSSKLRNRYEVYPIIDPMQVDGVFRRADLVIARAGANTVSDIIAAKRPAIFVPLPIAYRNEQHKNALFAKKFGIATVLAQQGLTPDILLDEIGKTFNSWNKIVEKVSGKTSPDIKASKRLVDIIEKIVLK